MDAVARSTTGAHDGHEGVKVAQRSIGEDRACGARPWLLRSPRRWPSRTTTDGYGSRAAQTREEGRSETTKGGVRPTAPATRKPTPATARTPTAHKPAPPAPRTAADFLDEALKDLGKAREKGGEEIRASIDSAIERIRETAKELGSWGQDQVGEWQKTLDAAADDALRELGRRAIRAQRSPEALTELSAEIRQRRGQLTRRARLTA
jgi:hypothetical protein